MSLERVTADSQTFMVAAAFMPVKDQLLVKTDFVSRPCLSSCVFERSAPSVERSVL